MDEREIRNLEQRKRELSNSYKKLADEDAFKDLMSHIEGHYQTLIRSAMKETSNSTEAMAALQQANAYDNMKSYINDFLA